VSQRRLTIGLCTTVVAIAFEVIAVATAMPVAARELDGLPYYAWSFSLFMVGMLVATVVAGPASDRRGPVLPMLAGLVTFAAGLVLAASAPHMAQLVAGRLVQGLGSGLINTAMFVIIARAFAPRQRPRMFTFISTAWVMPSFVGPPVSAWLTHALGWRWVFLAVLPLVVLGGLMVLPALLALRRTAPERVPGPAASLWAAGVVAAATVALQLAGQRLDLVAVALLAAGLAGLAVGLPRLMPPGFLRFSRGLPAVIVVRGLLPGAFFGAEAFIPLMLVEQRRIALLLAGATLTVGAVGWTTGAWLQSRPWLPVRRDRLITYGCGAVALGVAIVALVAAEPGVWAGVVGVGWLFAGLGMGLSMASTNLTVMAFSRPEEQGRNGASLNVSDALGSALFVALTGTLFAALQPAGSLEVAFGVLLAAMTGVALLAALVSLRIGAVRNELA